MDGEIRNDSNLAYYSCLSEAQLINAQLAMRYELINWTDAVARHTIGNVGNQMQMRDKQNKFK